MGVQLLGDLHSLFDKGVGEGEKMPALSYTEIFYQCLPHYLAMGMSADEFWNCDPRMYRVYRELKKIKTEEENERLWLEGMYIYQSILLCAPRLNSLDPKEPAEYPRKPFDLGLRDDGKEEEMTDEEIRATPEYVSMVDWMFRVNRQRQGEVNG